MTPAPAHPSGRAPPGRGQPQAHMFIFAPILNISCPGLMCFTGIFPRPECVPTFIFCLNTSNPKPEWVS